MMPSSCKDHPSHKSTWFISDLHLSPERSDLIRLFHDFLDDIQDKADALYILGDLFEFWIGDDVIDSPLGQAYNSIIEHLAKLSRSGVKLYLTTGNRDFLLSQKFFQCTEITALNDYHVITVYKQKILLCHGDTLCTDDRGYQRLRKLLRLRLVQMIYLALSLENRIQRAKKIRNYSIKHTQKKQNTILDVSTTTVDEIMTKFQVDLLIHGHTHRPNTHHFQLASGVKAQRMVLGDWQDKPCYIEIKSDRSITSQY
ncbi:MAG: UDP-2,3-diacylglucosamine diphosphatase [Thiotrichaceae bacterium]|nr:UDP-2,3-diacylglucosamine diphosphatase [Thiotrichaceae bacterium]